MGCEQKKLLETVYGTKFSAEKENQGDGLVCKRAVREIDLVMMQFDEIVIVKVDNIVKAGKLSPPWKVL